MSLTDSQLNQIIRDLHLFKLLELDYDDHYKHNQIKLLITYLEEQLFKRRERFAHSQISIGDRVEITNNYKGFRGKRGVVVHLTTHRITIRDSAAIKHTRAPKNLIRVPRNDWV